MEETLSSLDLVSLIEKKRNMPLKFSARKLWMIVHKEYPNISIEEFSKKLHVFSRNEEDAAPIDQINVPILEYKIEKNGVRIYKFLLNNHEVLKSKEIIRKIKCAMCSLGCTILQSNSPKIDDDLNLQDNNYCKENTQCAENNDFMTENEISEKIGIRKERIRPFIVILIELGIIVTEKIDREKYHHITNRSNYLKVADSKKEILKDKDYSQFKSINEQDQSNSNDFLIDNTNSLYLPNINGEFDDLKVNDKNDAENSGIDIDYNKMDDNIDNEGEMINNVESENRSNDQLISNHEDLNKRRLRWDVNQEMRIKNLSSSIQYLNNLRSMKSSLINLISEARSHI